MANQPQAKKTKSGNLKQQLKVGQYPTGKNSITANTIPQLEEWRKKHPRKIRVWEKG